MFSFGTFPQLQTVRAELVELEAHLAPDIFALRSDPVVQLYNSEPHRTLDDTLQFILEQRQRYSEQAEVIWGIRLREVSRVVGSVSIFGWDRYHRRAQIGYDLAKEHWGQGVAYEAIRAVLQFAFVEMDLNRVEIWTSAANERSRQLARRLGFALDGTLRGRILEDDGAFHDCAVFGLLRDEWIRTRPQGLELLGFGPPPGKGWQRSSDLVYQCSRCDVLMPAEHNDYFACACGAMTLDFDAGRFGSKLGDQAIRAYRRGH